MTWRDNSDNEDVFLIYNFDFFWATLANTTGITFDSFDLPSLPADPCFAVTAANDQGESDASVFCFPD